MRVTIDAVQIDRPAATVRDGEHEAVGRESEIVRSAQTARLIQALHVRQSLIGCSEAISVDDVA